MARGLDISGVQVVVNYQPPAFFRTYQHRVGRTARAGQSGVAYTLLAPDEVTIMLITPSLYPHYPFIIPSSSSSSIPTGVTLQQDVVRCGEGEGRAGEGVRETASTLPAAV